MIEHPELRLLVISPSENKRPEPWLRLAEELPHVTISFETSFSCSLAGYDTVISIGSASQLHDPQQVLSFVAAGGGWLVMTHLDEYPLPPEFGVKTSPVGQETELRVLFEDCDDPLSARLPDAVYVSGRYHPLEISAPHVETLLYVDWHYSHKPVWTTSKYGEGNLGCTTLQDFSSAMMRQLLHRLLRKWQGSAPAQEKQVGVGILGYAPSVGQVHGLATEKVSGLQLRAVCDLSEKRLSQAAADFPDVSLHDDAINLAEDADVELVIVATPPNFHAAHCLQMMRAGKHVLCEKPLALTSQETFDMLNAAKENGVHLSCHQNRRWDPDYLAIRNCVELGKIGELFHVETFVGGFHHPCGYWHSHSSVSGGTTFDWGAHYLDWIISLLPAPIEAVMGSRHKRVWHDVTNGDQERIQIRFTDGQEAEFLHSDIAAVRKPKWYLLGTEGAILGEWQDITAYHVDPVYYFEQSEIPSTEMMPKITLHRRLNSGEIEHSFPALPERSPFAFHANLTDHLLWGEPLAAPLSDSMKVVAVLEAASRSMSNNSRWETIAYE